MKKIVCFGDSVTLGIPYVHEHDTFVRVLERRLIERVTQEERVVCVNEGIGGETSAEGLARFEKSITRREPNLVCLEFGLNDIRYEPDKHVTPEQFARNLHTLYEKCNELGAQVIFMTPNPIINTFHVYSQMPIAEEFYKKWGNCNDAVIEYAQVIRDTAQSLSAPLCDIYAAFEAKAIEIEFQGGCFDWRDLTCLASYLRVDDGVHPTALGHELIARELYRVIVTEDLLK